MAAFIFGFLPIFPVFVFLAVVFVLFLFWRGARHELFSSQEVFDLILVAILGAGVFARLFDFFFKTDPADWSLATFVFFNRYGGFDFWGGILGMILAIAILKKGKKAQIFAVLDLAAAPLAFGQALVFLGSYLSGPPFTLRSLPLYYFCAYFLIFWAIKRFSTKKKHIGFFFSFYLFAISVLEIALFRLRADVNYIGGVAYELAAPAAFSFLAIANWYLLAKRNVSDDFKKFFGFILLSLFRTKRMLASADEAGKFSKSILFLPYYVLRALFVVILILGREIKLTFFELMYIFGLRKFLR